MQADQLTLIHPYLLFTERFKMEFDQPWRICYAHSIFLIEEGEGQFEVEDSIINVQVGTYLYIPSGVKHRILSYSKHLVFQSIYFDWSSKVRPGFETRSDYFHFHGMSISPIDPRFFGEHSPFQIPTSFTVEKLQPWLQLLEPIRYYDIIINLLSHEPLKYHGQFQLFLHRFLEFALQANQYVDQRIRRAISILDELLTADDFVVKGSIEQLLQSNSMSKSYFYTLFKKHTGFSPNAYLNRIKIEKIKDILKYSDLSITDISEKFNYSSLHYFSKQFYKLTGETPSSYRKRNKIYR